MYIQYKNYAAVRNNPNITVRAGDLRQIQKLNQTGHAGLISLTQFCLFRKKMKMRIQLKISELIGSSSTLEPLPSAI